MRITYNEILEMILRRVLTPPMARAIVRKSGFRIGGRPLEEYVKGIFFPPGGLPGDVLFVRYDSVHPERWVPVWTTPGWITARKIQTKIASIADWFHGVGMSDPGFITNFQSARSTYSIPPYWNYAGDANGPLGRLVMKPYPTKGDVPTELYTFRARNPVYPVGEWRASIWQGERSPELLVWEDVPAGTWHYPYNVDWFVTKRELHKRPGQYLTRQIKMRAQAIGPYPADMVLRYSVDGTSWVDLVSVDLSGGGPINGPWTDFPENSAAAGDVFLGLFVRARGSIARFHMGPIEVLMRWPPRRDRNLFVPHDEFAN